jgi:hypothetical protein
MENGFPSGLRKIITVSPSWEITCAEGGKVLTGNSKLTLL